MPLLCLVILICYSFNTLAERLQRLHWWTLLMRMGLIQQLNTRKNITNHECFSTIYSRDIHRMQNFTKVLNSFLASWILFHWVYSPSSPWFGNLETPRHCRRGILCMTHIQKCYLHALSSCEFKGFVSLI